MRRLPPPQRRTSGRAVVGLFGSVDRLGVATLMFDIVGCPQEGCDAPAETVPRAWTPNAAGGLTIHCRVLCVAGHTTFTEQAALGEPGAPPSTYIG